MDTWASVLFILLSSIVIKDCKATNSSEQKCSFEFIQRSCRPFKTFQTCRNGSCICPTGLRPVLLRNNLSIDTYWDSNHRQCVSKVDSVCFYLPPSFLVSQPYRCVAKNADCVQAMGQFRGVGICQCKKGYASLPSAQGCKSLSGVSVISLAENDTTEYQVEEQCSWKFQCPHLQECMNGRCRCPMARTHENGYKINMIWNKEENVCESTAGSYCNNARFHNPDQDMLMKSLLRSMMEVRCASGLNCQESEGIEIGVCSAASYIPGSFLMMKVIVMILFKGALSHY